MKMKIFFIIAAIIELSVYGIVYYFGYQRGKQEAEFIKTNIQLDIGKIAKIDKY
jgi:hypothetical protein